VNARTNVDTSTQDDKRKVAISLAERGFRVFPLEQDGRVPVMRDWPERASSDPAIVARFWSDALGEPEQYNIGIATGQGLVVLDFDCKHGKTGMATLEAWDGIPGELPRSLRARTASGGVHVYLSVPEDVDMRNTVDKLEPGVDVRAYHGYVIAPGSTIGDRTYSWDGDASAQIEPMADDMIERCLRCQGRAPAVERDDRPLPIEVDAPAAISRAIEWLRDEAPEAIENSGGDFATYNVCCKVRDFGISPNQAFSLISEYWNEAGKAIPPWNPEELERKIANAYRYAQNMLGVASAHADFVKVPMETADRRFWSTTFADTAREALTQPAKPLIKGLLDQGAMSVIYGESNAGKTFVALDLAYHVAAGVAWARHRVTRGRVVYVVAEGGRSFARRCEALRRAKGGTDIDLHVIRYPINLLTSAQDIAELILEIRSLGDVDLLVIDTLSRALAGGDENTSTDMGRIVKNLDHIRAATGAHIAVIHHSGKDRAKGARGHSLLRAATDTEIEIADNQIRVTKQRDMDAIAPIRFRLEPVDLGRDHDGDEVVSCVVETAGPGEALHTGLTADEVWFMRAAERVDGPLETAAVGAAMAEILQAEMRESQRLTGKKQEAKVLFYPERCGRTQEEFCGQNGLSAAVSYKNVRRLRTQCGQNGLIEKNKQRQWVTKVADNADNADK
jgi:hypothetical protein